MTPEQEKRLEDLKLKQNLAAGRLQRIVDVLADAAFLRELEIRPPQDESQLIVAYEQTLKRIDQLADEQERILREAGVLPRWND